jgi:hypothetical protein
MFQLALFSVFLAAAPETRPACNSETVGRMWPAEANTDPIALHKFSRAGSLWVCSRGTWRYRWTQPSVSVKDLKEQHASKGARRLRVETFARKTTPEPITEP